MKNPAPTPDDWPLLLSWLPADLEASAKACGALLRKRGVPNAQVLLRLAFAYTGWSLQATVTWARGAGIARLTAVALWKRRRRAADSASRLLAQGLAEHVALRRDRLPAGALRVRLMDARSVSSPGSTGTDYRLHLQFDLGTLTMADVLLTDASGGESLRHCRPAPEEIVVGDRGYAHRQGIATVVATEAAVIVRLGWQSVPLQHPDGTAFDLFAALRPLETGEIGEWVVQTAPDRDGSPALPRHLVTHFTGRETPGKFRDRPEWGRNRDAVAALTHCIDRLCDPILTCDPTVSAYTARMARATARPVAPPDAARTGAPSAASGGPVPLARGASTSVRPGAAPRPLSSGPEGGRP